MGPQVNVLHVRERWTCAMSVPRHISAQALQLRPAAAPCRLSSRWARCRARAMACWCRLGPGCARSGSCPCDAGGVPQKTNTQSESVEPSHHPEKAAPTRRRHAGSQVHDGVGVAARRVVAESLVAPELPLGRCLDGGIRRRRGLSALVRHVRVCQALRRTPEREQGCHRAACWRSKVPEAQQDFAPCQLFAKSWHGVQPSESARAQCPDATASGRGPLTASSRVTRWCMAGARLT